MLHPVIQFSHWHVYSDNCSCLIEQHSRTMAVIWLSCACKHTDRDLKVMMCTVTPLLDKQPWRAVRIDTLVLCVWKVSVCPYLICYPDLFRISLSSMGLFLCLLFLSPCNMFLAFPSWIPVLFLVCTPAFWFGTLLLVYTFSFCVWFYQLPAWASASSQTFYKAAWSPLCKDPFFYQLPASKPPFCRPKPETDPGLASLQPGDISVSSKGSPLLGTCLTCKS